MGKEIKAGTSSLTTTTVWSGGIGIGGGGGGRLSANSVRTSGLEGRGAGRKEGRKEARRESELRGTRAE